MEHLEASTYELLTLDVNICILKLMSTDSEIVLFDSAQSIKLKILLALSGKIRIYVEACFLVSPHAN